MNNIFIPIESTNLKSIIPPEEEIIYCTFCKVIRKIGAGGEWTHGYVIITKENIYFTIPGRKKQIDLNVQPLYSTRKMKKDELRIEMFITQFKPRRIPEFETKENFKLRMAEFERFLLPYIILAQKKELDLIQKKKENGQKYNKFYARKLPKRISTFEARFNELNS